MLKVTELHDLQSFTDIQVALQRAKKDRLASIRDCEYERCLAVGLVILGMPLPQTLSLGLLALRIRGLPQFDIGVRQKQMCIWRLRL